MRKIALKPLGLRGKLVVTMMALFVMSSVVLFQISQNAQKRLIQEVQENLDDLTKAIQVSVQKLTSTDEIDPGKLKELMQQFKRRGINEISILSGNRQIIASSDPRKIGVNLPRSSRESDFLIKAELGVKSSMENVKEFNIPIVIGNENYGFINIVMHLDSLARIQKRNFYLRLFSTLFIFVAGTLVIMYMANKYIKPVQKIVDGTKKIANEELAPLPLDTDVSPEMKELIVNFNDMVAKLQERKLMERRIQEMEHMFQVGQMSSAIAHEIKNPLNFMSLAVAQIRDETAEMDDERAQGLRPMLIGLEDEIRKLNTLVTNFLEYGRPLKLKMEYLRVREIIDDLLGFIGGRLRDLNIAVSFPPGTDAGIIGDREKLSGCFLNLFLNAIDAIRENGRIEIGVERKGDRVEIRFRDSGQGVEESIRDRIFEPYFSSKQTGMGLGLAFTKKIVLEHGGDIWLNRDCPAGAEFIVSLPANIDA